MKILHLVFHPDLSTSRVNKVWAQKIADSGKVATSRDLYADYPDFQIDVAREQELLLSHDRFVVQFPLYWYSCPPLFKKWLDDVFTYGFAYGSTGTALNGKDFQLITSVGGGEKYHTGFDTYATIHELFRPYQMTAKLSGMNYMMPVWMYRANDASEDTIQQYADKWVDLIDDPLRANPDAFVKAQKH